jgi:hypothetical protein
LDFAGQSVMLATLSLHSSREADSRAERAVSGAEHLVESEDVERVGAQRQE